MKKFCANGLCNGLFQAQNNVILLSYSIPKMTFTLFHAISNRTEVTFGRLRYSLGGDRPSQTVRLTLSPTPLRGMG